MRELDELAVDVVRRGVRVLEEQDRSVEVEVRNRLRGAEPALKRLNEDPPTPTAIGRPQPAGLEAIVMRALAREPAGRFPDAGAMAEALRAWRRNPDAVPAGVAAGAVVAATT